MLVEGIKEPTKQLYKERIFRLSPHLISFFNLQDFYIIATSRCFNCCNISCFYQSKHGQLGFRLKSCLQRHLHLQHQRYDRLLPRSHQLLEQSQSYQSLLHPQQLHHCLRFQHSESLFRLLRFDLQQKPVHL